MDKYLGAILGLVVGDALGVPVELQKALEAISWNQRETTMPAKRY